MSVDATINRLIGVLFAHASPDDVTAFMDQLNATMDERDAAIARAERAEADVAAWKRVTGRDDHDALDFELGRTGIDTHLRVLNALLRDRPEITTADAREACAHGLTVSADHGVDVGALFRIERALRAHAAKVSR